MRLTSLEDKKNDVRWAKTPKNREEYVRKEENVKKNYPETNFRKYSIYALAVKGPPVKTL